MTTTTPTTTFDPTTMTGYPTVAAVISGFTIAPSLLADPDLCTTATCPLSFGYLNYLPSVPGNAFYVAFFAVILLTQLGLGLRYRTWGFTFGMCCGVILEVIGYAGRIMEHYNDFTQTPFLIYIVCLTIGPAFLSGSIYLCLARIVVTYGKDLSRFQPRTYTITFMTFDFISLLLQAAGGGITASANTASLTQIGVNIMIAGLAFQVASLGCFAILCSEFAWRVRRTLKHDPSLINPATAELRNSFKFRAFLVVLGLATLAIFIRSCFRCAELNAGFDGALANNQVLFMVLEGMMISIAVLALTLMHPGFAFQGQWANANWSLKKSKAGDMEKAALAEDSGNESEAHPVAEKRRWIRMPGSRSKETRDAETS